MLCGSMSASSAKPTGAATRPRFSKPLLECLISAFTRERCAKSPASHARRSRPGGTALRRHCCGPVAGEGLDLWERVKIRSSNDYAPPGEACLEELPLGANLLI